MTSTDPHVTHSRLRESITTHAFLAAIGTEIWRRGHFETEIVRPEFDAGGYDLAITANGVTRHIQLKAAILSSKQASWDASQRLADQPSGCVIVLHVDDQNLQIRQYGLFAGSPGQPLPELKRRRASKNRRKDPKGSKAARRNRWAVPKGRFDIYDEVAGLYNALFGPEPSDSGQNADGRPERR